MIGRLHHVVLDCPDPRRLAAFYAELLGRPVTYDSDDWVVVAENAETSGLAFQLAPDHVPPRWPDPAFPQQVHLDVMVDDVDVRGGTGARARRSPAVVGPSPRDACFLDPAGHPFCLIPRPGWAPPVHG